MKLSAECAGPPLQTGDLCTKASFSVQDILAFFHAIPGDPLPEGKLADSGRCFTTGSFVRGPLVGLRVNSRLYPDFSRALCTFVNAEAPQDFLYSAIAIFENLQVGRHRDTNNFPNSLNFVYPLSDFTGGSILCYSTASVGPKRLTFEGGPVLFDARAFEHEVEAWSGERAVLVAFSTRGVQALPAMDRAFLKDLGFRLPWSGASNLHLQSDFDWCVSEVDSSSPGAGCPLVASGGRVLEPTPVFPPEPPAGVSAPAPSSSCPLFVEVFAGCARLSAEFAAAGFHVLAVDGPHNKHKPLHQVWTLDLTLKTCQELLVQRLLASDVLLIHVGLPCGTGSRARERPLPEHVLASGVEQPRPLRSSDHVLGVPNLSPKEAAKVEAANSLAAFTIKLLALARDNAWHISIENPVRSWMWAVLAKFVLDQKSPGLASFYSDLHHVDYAQCMLGGQRAKMSRLLTSLDALCPLACECDGQHKHLPFALTRVSNRWQFDTALEAEYPLALCQKFCSLVKATLPLQPRPLPRPTVRQSRRLAPLIPEFRSFSRPGLPRASFASLFRKGVLEEVAQLLGFFTPSTSLPKKRWRWTTRLTMRLPLMTTPGATSSISSPRASARLLRRGSMQARG